MAPLTETWIDSSRPFALATLLFVAAVALGACAPAPAREPGAATIVDGRGKSVSIARRDRLVSIGGAVTETICALGASASMIAVDSSSTFPEAVRKLPTVGYQRTLAAEGVLSLTPDLVVASADAGPPAALAQIESAGVPIVVVGGEHSVEGAAQRIEMIGRVLHREPEAARLIESLELEARSASQAASASTEKPTVLFVLARGAGTIVVAGQDTAADAMIGLAGARNAISGYDGYRPLTPEAAIAAAPTVILTTSAGLDSVGGVDGILKLPGIGETPAGKARRVVALDDLYLLGFGPRTGAAIRDVALALLGRPTEGGA